MKKILLTTFLLTSLFNLSAQQIAKGYVFEDINNDGQKEKKEKGIANVAVSNGTDVVLTDSEGKYNLPVGDDNIIFVIKPAGYKIPANEYNFPKSYYIHKPKGSPSSFYKGVEPTGELPESIDFGLIRYNEPEVYSSFIFGDSQTYSEQEVEYFTKGIVNEAKERSGLSFGITLGDLVGDNLNLHLSYKKAIKQMGLPWYNVIGNHDMNYDAKEDIFSDETFESNFGPANYSFNYGKVHYIVLDDILYPNPVTGKEYMGGLREDQLKFIENDLKFVRPDQLIIISMHIPLLDRRDKDAFRETDRQQLYSLLNSYPNVLVLSAHTHIQSHNFIGKEDGLNREKPIHEYNVGTSCGDWYSGALNAKGLPTSTMRDGTPQGYAIVNIKGDKYTLDYKVAGQPDDYQISIYNPKVVPYKGRWITSGIYANFFMGSNNDSVEYRVDEGPWTKMTKIDDYDPAYYRYMQDWDYSDEVKPVRRPSNAQICRHLWRASIPSNLPVGEHRIEVRATDMFGRVFTQNSSYQIKELPK
ncbi:calcineurin-like phosphoesterase C-terminal domain-containing protein [Dysgonomonas termitidis]|uniref:Calcineurin-like phosphoesterase C-terminal domain-containing protein n=1 Tax=Dysgonomonas termitidis TaxID=1516126 RepID=A0ABV9KRG7_9BACT